MQRLNYQHLFYFWNIVKEGGITKACEKLHLAQPTISSQLAVFEQAVGEKLFDRIGRKLILTETGQVIFNYAEEIFALGQELISTLKGRPTGRRLRLTIGMADALPKLIAYRLIEPALNLSEPVQVICHEDKAERLLEAILRHDLDLVLSDIPATPSAGTKVFNHFLGKSTVAVYGSRKLASRYRKNFPDSLNGAPMLLPTTNTSLRRSLDQWFDSERLYPNILAEIDDSALLKTFASAGVGLFVSPVVVDNEIHHQYSAEVIGGIDTIQERFYAVSAQRKLKHPAVLAILNHAQTGLFEA